MTNVFLDAHRLVMEHGPGEGQRCLHSWVVIFAFGMKKRGLHEDHVRFPRSLIGNDGDGEVPVQERPSLLRPSTTVVVVWKIHRPGIAVAIILTGGAGIAVAVAVTVISRAGIAIGHAVRINDHHGVPDALALRISACVYINVVQLILRITLAIRDSKTIGRLAQLFVEFHSGIEQ